MYRAIGECWGYRSQPRDLITSNKVEVYNTTEKIQLSRGHVFKNYDLEKQILQDEVESSREHLCKDK